jgi:hypothetical protein
MKDESIRKSLETIAQSNIPDNTNLWPRLAARLEKKEALSMNRKWRLVWTILLVLLGLFALTGVAYAFYRYFNNDAGLQSVSNAGMLATVNVTAQPTPNPTATPPAPVTVIGNSQTLEGTSLTLEWIYLMDGRQAFGFSADGLAGGKTLGMPVMSFGRLVPEQYSGASLAIKDDAQPVTGTYVVNQIVRDDATFGKADTRTGVSIDIPLLDGNGQVLNTFRFAVKDELVHIVPLGGGNIYSTTANGLEMSLDWVLLRSKTVQARLCFAPPDGKDWRLVSPTLQLGADPNQLASVTPVPASGPMPLTDENGTRCQDVSFPVSTQGAQAFFLTAGDLVTPAGETLKGDWTFNWYQLPGQMQFPGIAPLEPAPLSTADIGSNMTVTLEKAYADVFRMVFVVSVKSPQTGLGISNAALKDASGTVLNTGMGIDSQPDDPPGRYTLEFYPLNEFPAGQFKGQLLVEIGNQFGSSSSQAQAHFTLDVPVYPAIVFDPMQKVTANGVEMLLQRVRVTPSFTRAYLCFQKPSQADWGIGSMSTLKIGEDTGTLTASTLLFDAPGMGNMPKNPEPGWVSPVQTGRCLAAGFTVGHHGKPETLALNIPWLEQSLPEVIPNEQIQAGRQKLLAQGIDMDWVTSSGNGGGGGGPVINAKPAGMTDEQVMQLFFEALGYYHPGPWTFTVAINP